MTIKKPKYRVKEKRERFMNFIMLSQQTHHVALVISTVCDSIHPFGANNVSMRVRQLLELIEAVSLRAFTPTSL